MSVIDEHSEEVYERVRAILSEHFPNFMFCVMDDDGELYYDYTNVPIGKMLIREMKDDMQSSDDSVDWSEWDVEDDDDEGEEWKEWS